MTSIASNLEQVRKRIAAACLAAGRSPSDVRLVAVSKEMPAAAIRDAVAAGQTVFGENRFQDAEPKLRELAESPIEWHFLGRIQTNKLARILEHFDVLESLDRIEVLEKAEKLLASRGRQRKGLLEVHISGEATKAGFEPEEIQKLVSFGGLARFRHLNLAGVMGIAPHTSDRSAVRKSFELLKRIYDEGRRAGLKWDTLSMGMSSDFEDAIAAGSTEVRVGTSIFGSRAA